MNQRLRIEFSKGNELRFISHLDLMRAWHRVLRRAKIPLAYSEGFVPRPKLSLAAPLAVGATSEAELMDVYLTRPMSPLTMLKAITPQLPKGLEAGTVEEVPVSLPSLQSLMQAADYAVFGRTDRTETIMREAIEYLLARETLPWRHKRENETRQYDLRPLIVNLSLQLWKERGEAGAEFALAMRLRADSNGTGRPDQVIEALGLEGDDASIHRTGLVLQREDS